MRFLNYFFIPVVQEYLNEISPTIYGPNNPKTSGKPLRIPNLQTPASNHDKPATLYMDVHRCHNWRSVAINPALVASVGPSLVIT